MWQKDCWSLNCITYNTRELNLQIPHRHLLNTSSLNVLSPLCTSCLYGFVQHFCYTFCLNPSICSGTFRCYSMMHESHFCCRLSWTLLSLLSVSARLRIPWVEVILPQLFFCCSDWCRYVLLWNFPPFLGVPCSVPFNSHSSWVSLGLQFDCSSTTVFL